MDATVSAIVGASKLPFSILIVGVGDADFSSMRTLVSTVHYLQFHSPIPIPVPISDRTHNHHREAH